MLKAKSYFLGRNSKSINCMIDWWILTRIKQRQKICFQMDIEEFGIAGILNIGFYQYKPYPQVLARQK